MENASKALIIAGAILLAILLISLGIGVYQQAKSTVSTSNLDSQQIEAFNSDWDTYTTRAQTASDIKSMIHKVIGHNATERNSGDNRFIDVDTSGLGSGSSSGTDTNETSGTTVASKESNLTSPLQNGQRYTVKADYSNSGLITKLTVTVAGSSSSNTTEH